MIRIYLNIFKNKNILIAGGTGMVGIPLSKKLYDLGANIYIKKPGDFKKLKKVLSEVVSINWQYHTNSLNKDNFLLRV